MKSKRQIISIVFLLSFCLNWSCKKYLEAIPDKSLTVPKSLKELQGVLDMPSLNEGTPTGGELASDNLYLPLEDWNYFFFLDDRLAYIWDKETDLNLDWKQTYQKTFRANVVLDGLRKFEEESQGAEYKNIKGSALFLRASNFYEMAQLFSPPYSTAVLSLPLGIPLRVTPDITERSVRSTVEQTYANIISDLKEAAGLLPPIAIHPMRPSKASSYGLLARTYLVMQDYNNAEKYADSSLRLYDKLMNYNDAANVDPLSELPFKRFNPEVLFHSTSLNIGELLRSKVDTNFVKLYDDNDIRKKAFFLVNPDGSFHFKGSYDGTLTVIFFSGLTTPELYLIRAECRARNGQLEDALNDLNVLLANRWLTGTLTPIASTDQSKVLSRILAERRKELCFRGGHRWSDLRRLNQDSNFAITLFRHLNGKEYSLPPNDPRYTFLIPTDVIDKSGIQQNPR